MVFLITGIVFLLIGYILGSPAITQKQSDYFSNQIEKYANDDFVDLSVCMELDTDQQKSCINGSLQRAAYLKLSSDYCNSIDDSVIQDYCVSRVETMTDILNSRAGDFCEGLESFPICTDLAVVLQSQILSDPTYCSNLRDVAVRNFCNSLFVEEELTSSTAPHPLGRTECINDDPSCQSSKRTFNKAVLESNPNLCKSLDADDTQLQLCLEEVILYEKVLAGNIDVCTISTGADIGCQISVISFKANEENNVDLCNQIADQDAVGICKKIVNNEAPGRFDYLQQ